MSILITGASGYIGSNLVKQLLKEGRRDIIGVVNNHDLTLDNVKIIRSDLTNKDNIRELLKNDIDTIIHLAGQVYNKDIPNEVYLKYNFNITENLLETARIYNVSRFIFSSSMAVYGISDDWFNPLYLPIDEKHPIKPYEYYGLSKYLAEVLCSFYNNRYGIDITILRYSRVYGPESKGFVTKSIKNALANKDIIINRDITTDFVFIDDVIYATLKSLSLKGFNVFNIGSGEEKRLSDIANLIVRELNSSSNIEIINKEGSRFYYDISKARRELCYMPLDIKNGIKKCIMYYRI